MRVSALHTYPVKGCYRVDHGDVRVEPWGLAGDRRWALIDADGVMITQRDLPGLVRIKPVATGDRLRLRADGHPDLVVDSAPGELLDFAVFASPVRVSPVGEAADAWLSMVLDQKVRLVWLDDPTRRAVAPEWGEPADRLTLTDDFPVSLGNLASLRSLNDMLMESGSPEGPLPIARFRPNIELEGATPWAEDDWVGGRLRVGPVVFRAPRVQARCVVTTTDQETGVRGHEPLRALGRHRNVNQELLFGLALIPENTGTIAVGDEVEPLRS